MAKRQMRHLDILAAKRGYEAGENVTELLRRQQNVIYNTPEIIEAAYDLQSGSYIEHVEKNFADASLYTGELAAILDKHVGPGKSMLDIGTGELTTLSLLVKQFKNKPESIYAFDISWSRVYKGLSFAKKTLGPDYDRLTPFVGDVSEIPLRGKSINVTTSSHALEPNGSNLRDLMGELFRVTADKLVLFEPSYEDNSAEGKQRMDRLGYIKNIDGVVKELGGKLIEKLQIQNISNPLNPTYCFVITPPTVSDQPSTVSTGGPSIFSAPGTDHELRLLGDFYFSNDTGFCFPSLKSIPILKSNAAVLASALIE
jgi:hypothetical protein